MKMRPASMVIFAGVTAALHVGKLPPALPVLRASLGITLLESGFLLSLVQLAGMLLGLALGLLADGFGLRRSMVSGLVVLAVASALGGFASGATEMLALRALEGFGFLLVVLPAPALIRRLVEPQRMALTMGLWGTYMPFGAALALAVGPLVMELAGWRLWWCLLASVSMAMALGLWRTVPDDRANSPVSSQEPAGWIQRLRQTLGSRGPWMVASCFGLYSGQWLAVVGFLPTVYAEAGIAGRAAGALTALVAAVNVTGNMASGRLLQRGVPAGVLLYTGFLTMGLSTVVAFAGVGDLTAGPRQQLISVLAFSSVGGHIPGTLFSLAVKVSPSPQTVSTTVGWVQQLSALGQLCGPPVAAWVAGFVGNWHSTWWVTGGCSLAGLVIASMLGRLVASPPSGKAGA